jgi:hypothetical protein
MLMTRVALLSGVAAVVLGGFASIANAQTQQSHVMTLRLPDGRLEQVQYVGDVPPTVVLAPAAVPSSFDSVFPIALLRQMSADMDRQAVALFQSVNGQAVANAGGFGIIPAMSGPGVCSRSVQITFTGNGQAPHVVSQTTGDCGPVTHGDAAPAALPNGPVPHKAPNLGPVVN